MEVKRDGYFSVSNKSCCIMYWKQTVNKYSLYGKNEKNLKSGLRQNKAKIERCESKLFTNQAVKENLHYIFHMFQIIQ